MGCNTAAAPRCSMAATQPPLLQRPAKGAAAGFHGALRAVVTLAVAACLCSAAPVLPAAAADTPSRDASVDASPLLEIRADGLAWVAGLEAQRLAESRDGAYIAVSGGGLVVVFSVAEARPPAAPLAELGRVNLGSGCGAPNMTFVGSRAEQSTIGFSLFAACGSAGLKAIDLLSEPIREVPEWGDSSIPAERLVQASGPYFVASLPSARKKFILYSVSAGAEPRSLAEYTVLDFYCLQPNTTNGLYLGEGDGVCSTIFTPEGRSVGTYPLFQVVSLSFYPHQCGYYRRFLFCLYPASIIVYEADNPVYPIRRQNLNRQFMLAHMAISNGSLFVVNTRLFQVIEFSISDTGMLSEANVVGYSRAYTPVGIAVAQDVALLPAQRAAGAAADLPQSALLVLNLFPETHVPETALPGGTWAPPRTGVPVVTAVPSSSAPPTGNPESSAPEVVFRETPTPHHLDVEEFQPAVNGKDVAGWVVVVIIASAVLLCAAVVRWFAGRCLQSAPGGEQEEAGPDPPLQPAISDPGAFPATGSGTVDVQDIELQEVGGTADGNSLSPTLTVGIGTTDKMLV